MSKRHLVKLSTLLLTKKEEQKRKLESLLREYVHANKSEIRTFVSLLEETKLNAIDDEDTLKEEVSSKLKSFQEELEYGYYANFEEFLAHLSEAAIDAIKERLGNTIAEGMCLYLSPLGARDKEVEAFFAKGIEKYESIFLFYDKWHDMDEKADSYFMEGNNAEKNKVLKQFYWGIDSEFMKKLQKRKQIKKFIF